MSETEEEPETTSRQNREICLLTLQTDASQPLFLPAQAANNVDLGRTVSDQGFQLSNNVAFGGNFTSKAHKRAPEYRKMARYAKSVKQYKRERERRKAAYELGVQGFSYKQIAEKLGVSAKTVQRDMRKLRPYLERRHRHAMEQLSLDMSQRLEAHMAGLSELQRFQRVTSLLLDMKKEQHYNRQNFKLYIDLDHLIEGVFPTITTWPKPPFTLTHKPGEQWFMHFIYKQNGREYPTGHLQVG